MVLPQGAAPGAGPNNPPPQGAAPGAGPNNPPPPGAVLGAGPNNPPQPGAAPGTGPNNPPQPGAAPGAGPNNPHPPGAVPGAGPNNPPPPGAIPGARPNNPPPPGAPPGAGPNNPPQPGAAPGAGPNNPPPPGAAPGAGPNNPPPPGAPPGAGPNIPPQQGAPQVAPERIQRVPDLAKLLSIVSCICSVALVLINVKKPKYTKALRIVALIIYVVTAYKRREVAAELRASKANAPRNIWDITINVGMECLYWIPKIFSCVSLDIATTLPPKTQKKALKECEKYLKQLKIEASKCAAPRVNIDNAVSALTFYEGSVADLGKRKLLSDKRKQLKSFIPQLQGFEEIEHKTQVCLNDLAFLSRMSGPLAYKDFITILKGVKYVLRVKKYDEFKDNLELLKTRQSNLKSLKKTKDLDHNSFNYFFALTMDYIYEGLKRFFPCNSKTEKLKELENESKKCLTSAVTGLDTSKKAIDNLTKLQQNAATAVVTLADFLNYAEENKLRPKLEELCKATKTEMPSRLTRDIIFYGNIVCVGMEIWHIWNIFRH